MTQFRLFFPKETSDLDSIGFALKVGKVAAYKIVGDAQEVGRDTQTPARTRGKAGITLQAPLNGEQSGLRLSTDDEKRALGSHRGN